ncbi:hypothetical protein [uncultured phage MedDCM-OCT-S04-C890]|nr:hypothetical protein [uncultured phage MedDCM-OCT-S04-C890]
MIDKMIYKFFGLLDKFASHLDRIFFLTKRKEMKVSENTSVAMPIKNMVGIIVAVAMGIFAYTEVTARLTSLETSRELMNSDLLKKDRANNYRQRTILTS